MSKLVEILVQRKKSQEKYFKNYLFFAKKIKKISQKFLGKARVIVFGSILRKEVPRDIDILIISPEFKSWEKKRKLYLKISREIGILAPFEFHFVTEKEYQNWYKFFVKEKIEV